MERHDVLINKIDWPNLLQHVVRDKVAVELVEGQVPIAKLIPVEPPKTMEARPSNASNTASGRRSIQSRSRGSNLDENSKHSPSTDAALG